jgi:formylglycine-generating enzyme required for sulfatase activity
VFDRVLGQDAKTKLTWQRAVPAAKYAWADAKTYCQTLGSSLGGTGWRLPTIKEIQTIVDESRTTPSVDPTAFPATPATNFWSSSVVAGSPLAAWFITFDAGVTYFFAMAEMLNVRCVR